MKCVLLLLLMSSSCLCHPRPLLGGFDKMEACSDLQVFADSLENNFAASISGVCKMAVPSAGCVPAAVEEVIRNCLEQDGFKIDEKCFQDFISDEDSQCSCGGLLEFIKMIHAVDDLLCATPDKRDSKLFFPWSSVTATLPGDVELHPVILLPGDGGSRIQAKLDDPSKDPFLCTKVTNDFYDIWVNIEQLSLGIECWKQNMALVYDPVTRTTSDIQGVTTRIPGTPPAGTTVDIEWLDPSDIWKDATVYYAKMVEKLSALGYKTGVNLHGAPYDWRRAANEQEQYFIELRNLIQNTYEKNGNTPVIMIAHSMGCTMSLYFLTQQTQAWKDKYVKSLITLAGPWGGSAKSLEIFAVGTDLSDKINNIPILSEVLMDATRFVERTNPSLAWMMPTSQVWSSDPLVKTTSMDYTAANIGDFFKLLGVPNMAMMYEDTRELTASLPSPGVEAHCLYGSAVPTTEQLVYSWDPQSSDQAPVFRFGSGDGTVNEKSLKGCQDWAGVTTQEFPGQTHMEMVTGDTVTNYVANLVNDLNQQPM